MLCGPGPSIIRHTQALLSFLLKAPLLSLRSLFHLWKLKKRNNHPLAASELRQSAYLLTNNPNVFRGNLIFQDGHPSPTVNYLPTNKLEYG